MHGERYSKEETRKVAEKLLSFIVPKEEGATVVGLSGDLGAGKTTLTQEIGTLLGVTERIQSPTFVIAKFYAASHPVFSELIHIDAYRIEHGDELRPLGWEKLLLKPRTLLIIEWPERIEGALPSDTQRFIIAHDGEHRIISRTAHHG